MIHTLGVIDDCATAGCGRRCCDFSQGNYIVLYPGELNAAVARGESLAHLAIRPVDEGGHRAVCRAADKSVCDGGYKPLDCASYPLFPTLNEDGSVAAELAGEKCPLRPQAVEGHRDWVIDQWSRVARISEQARRWLARVKLIGYS